MNASPAMLPVAVIGAGPVGLAAAAHLLARGFTPLVLEAGPAAGANLRTYAHVQLFSPWRYNIDRQAQALLELQEGWRAPELDALPTAGELVRRYLEPLAAHAKLAPHIHYSHKVVSITRAGVDKVKTAQRETLPFTIRVSVAGGEREFSAQAILDASGTWNQPNPIGASGVPALGETALAARIAYGMPDILGTQRERYAGKRVLVIGAGHSAAGNLIALAELAEAAPGTQLVWALRGSDWTRIFGGGANDGLPARGRLGQRLKALRDRGALQVHSGFRAHEVRVENGRLTVLATPAGGESRRISGIDEIIAATGARPDFTLARELRIKLDHWLESTEALAPLIDPNEHSCGTVRPHGHRELAHPEPGYYAVGAKSYGRAPTFLLATGYEQVRSVVAALAGDLAAADAVQLELPETGVCSVSFEQAPVEAGCCGGPAKEPSSCCVADEAAKQAGAVGCGCSSSPAPEARPMKPEARAIKKSACCA